MGLTLDSMSMQPADLIGDCLLCFHLDGLVNSRPDVIPFNGRYNLFDLFGHILRINRDDLIAVFAAQLALVLQLKPVKADKFIIFIAQAGISVDFFIAACIFL